MNIAGVDVGQGHPCRTVAEISNNHNSKWENAVRLLDRAKDVGADCAKVQVYTPDELVALRGDGPAPEPWGSQGWTMRKLYEKAMTPPDWFGPLFEHARAIRLPLFASVFGFESLTLMEALGCPAYKIASLDCDTNMAALAWRTRKPVIRSSPVPMYWPGMLSLYCPPGYPQTDPALKNVAAFDGFSYHGTDPMVPVYAVALGAHMVECHLQLDEEPSELEAGVSLGVTQFGYMVQEIRRVEALL